MYIWPLIVAGWLMQPMQPTLVHDGYEGINSPTGSPCCGANDCGPTEVRTKDGKLQAHIIRHEDYYNIDGWYDIPPSAILPGELNPIAGPSACFWAGAIRCFFPGRDT